MAEEVGAAVEVEDVTGVAVLVGTTVVEVPEPDGSPDGSPEVLSSKTERSSKNSSSR
eukprot:Nk52_evm1s1752 gene=Nk52_evmTU1s1752